MGIFIRRIFATFPCPSFISSGTGVCQKVVSHWAVMLVMVVMVMMVVMVVMVME